MQLIGWPPGSAQACTALADALAIRGRVSEAVEVYYRLTDVFFDRGDFEGAVETARWVLQVEPHSVRARMKIVLAYTKSGEIPKLIESTSDLARILVEVGRADEALELLTTTQHSFPESPEIDEEMGDIYLTHQYFAEAAKHFRASSQKYLDQGEMPRASEIFRKLKQADPSDKSRLLRPLRRICAGTSGRVRLRFSEN